MSAEATGKKHVGSCIHNNEHVYARDFAHIIHEHIDNIMSFIFHPDHFVWLT
jgi:hypothetical protein